MGIDQGHAAQLARYSRPHNAGTYDLGDSKLDDLTQAVFSFAREDAENKFLPMYNETGILQDNPFEVLDVYGVGQLIEMAVEAWSSDAQGPEDWNLWRTRRSS